MAISNLTIRAATTDVNNLVANVDSNITIKGTPLSHEELDLNFLELAETILSTADQNPLEANLDANSFSILNVSTLSANTITGNLTGNVTGNTTGVHTGNVTGNVTGNTTGVHTGNVTGNVTGTVSSIANHNTSNLAEGTRLYYTDTRVNNVIANTSINALSDVNTAGASANSILKYDGANWVVGTDTDTDTTDISANSITDLSDVDTTGVVDGNFLMYVSANAKWEVTTVATDISANSIADLSDVDTTGITANSILKYDGNNWVIGTDDTGTIAANSITETEIDTANINVGVFGKDGTYVEYNNIINELDMNQNNITAVGNIDANNAVFGIANASDINVDILSSNSITTADSISADSISVRYIQANVDVSNTYPLEISTFERYVYSTSSLSTHYSSIIAKATSNGAVSDGFGPLIDFKIEDSTGEPNVSLGFIGFVRSSDNDSGKFIIDIADSGTVSNALSISPEGNVGLGSSTNAKLDMNNGTLLLGNLSNADIANVSAVNGMMVYNTDTNKFQGYASNSWVNLH